MKISFNTMDSKQGGGANPSRIAYLVLMLLLVAGFLFAGGARDDLLSLLVWRPLSMVVLAIALVVGWRAAWLNGRAVVALALSVVGLTALHLVPLPPAIWTALPGRDILVSIYRDAGMALPWQPLSVAQARTWNALFSLAAPVAALVLVLNLDAQGQRKLMLALIALGFVSGIIGMLQALGPAQGPLYFYRITNNGVSVGLFANRNHQAAFLAAMFPLIAANLSLFKGKPEQLFFHRAIAIAGGLLLVPLILMTGSRAGIVLGIVGIASAWWVFRSPVAHVRSAERKTDNRKRLIGFGLAGVLLVFSIIVAMRTPALQRLVETDPADELRLSALPIIVQAIERFFPFGSGAGTFVEVYQIFEPNKFVTAFYFNHAHNDFAELLLTTGLPGVALIIWAAFLGLASLRSLFRSRGEKPGERGFQAQVLGRAGFSIIAMLALYSAADYPLRVPSLMLLVAVAAAWCSAAYKAARK
jgi:O-antigen ligase